ncbi:MAG: 2-dehydro-3-deoxygalactonokinase [Cyclobacteriaceae bacterium]
MKDPKTILCIDWGTSSFRGALVDAVSRKILKHFHSDDGCKKLFQESKDKRVSPFDYFLQHLKEMLSNEGINQSAYDQIIISGMASSSIGMKELPYATIPFPIDGSGVVSETFHAEELGKVALISGAASDQDIMRGEETQCIGLKELSDTEKFILILPGTHSKHMEIVGGRLVSFKTYLTGELFQLICEQSVLNRSVEKARWSPNFAESFNSGVKDALTENLLNELFRIRARDILGKSNDPHENYYYLSGLLIGGELQELNSTPTAKLFACDEKMRPLYELAAQESGLTGFSFLDSEQLASAYITGQLTILKNLS